MSSEGKRASERGDVREDQIVAFFRGGPDTSGRTLDEILAWDDVMLEDAHDYIQWVFPTTRRSDFNPTAPVLAPGAIAEFKRDGLFRERLVQALRRMLRFYGFELAESGGHPVVTHGANWPVRRIEWLSPGDHNLLRITRILDSLSTLGLNEHARALLSALLELEKGADGRAIGARTFQFWRDAVKE